MMRSISSRGAVVFTGFSSCKAVMASSSVTPVLLLTSYRFCSNSASGSGKGAQPSTPPPLTPPIPTTQAPAVEKVSESVHEEPATPPTQQRPEASATTASKDARQEAGDESAASKTASAESASVHAQEILEALRSRDFTAAQGRTQKLVATHWQDDYALPLACILCFIVTWYWHASSYRRVARNVQKQEAKVIEDAKAIEDKVTELTTRMSKNLANRSLSALEVQRQNSELTRVIDQMTTALKQCPPRGG